VDLVQTKLLTPMVLAFVLGVVAARVGSDLKLPDAIYAGLSIYLIFAIGLKGGAALSQASLPEVAAPAAERRAIPEAKPSLYLTPILAVTSPVDLTVGISLFHAFARWRHL